MHPATAPTARPRTAIALSIVGHLCALSLLAVLTSKPASLRPDDAGIAEPGVVVTRITRRAPRPRKPAIAAPAAAAAEGGMRTILRPSRPRIGRFVLLTGAEPRTVREAPAPGVLGRRSAPAISAFAPIITARLRPPAGRTTSASPRLASAALVTSVAALRIDAASPTPSPAPSATATSERADEANFRGLFSENYPPALLAPEIISAVRAHVGGHLHVRVSVDEHGHATDVQFLAPVADPALADSLRAKLLAVNYIPADCNGLHCDGVLEIAY